jgi:periplasmic protein TonB
VSSASGDGRRLGTLGLTALAALALHAGGLAAASRLEPRRPEKAQPVEVEFEAVAPEPPPAPPPRAAPPPPPEPPARTRVAYNRLPPPKADEAPPPPPPPSEPPPPDAPPARAAPRVGISLSSTAQGGAFAVGVGNTLRGKASEVAADPKDVKPYAAPEDPAAPAPRPSRQPRLLSRPEVPPYPPEARRAGVEGQVRLLLRIDAQGRVAEARVLAEPGAGLGEAARQDALRLRFSPGLLEGEPVEVPDYPYTYTFVLE